MNWIKTKDQLPETETPVLIVCNKIIRVGALFWEKPMFEEAYEAYKYWDDPNNSLSDIWEDNEVTHWMPMPELPEELK